MIDTMLADGVVDFITGLFVDYTVADEKGKEWPLAVVKGFLPPKRTEEIEDFEKYCILVRYADGEADWIAVEDQSKSINRLLIFVRTWSGDVQLGPQNTINLMAMIQQRLYATPIVAKKYRATYPMKWTAPDGQSYPIWQGEMTIPFFVPMVQELFIGGVYDE